MEFPEDDFDTLYPGTGYDDSPIDTSDMLPTDYYGSYTGGGSEENVFDPTSVYEITNTATNPGEPGYNWKYYSDGTSISPDGKYFYQGEMVYDVNNPDGGTLAKLLGKEGAKALKGLFVNDKGEPNLAGIGSLGMGLYGLLNQDKQGGYNKPVPKMDMVREQIQYNDPNRRPGEAGRQYFTDPRYAAQGDAEALAAAKTASADQASGIQAAYQPRPAPAPNPYAGKMNLAYSRPDGAAPSLPRIDTTPVAEQLRSLGGQNEALEAYRRSMGPNFQPAPGGLAGALGDYLKNMGSQPAQQPRSYTPEPSGPISKDDPFYQSDEYKAFMKNPDHMVGTADMYDSPYFGRLGSGSIGSAMDDAYRKYKGISNPAPGGVPTGFIGSIGGGLGNSAPGAYQDSGLMGMLKAIQTTPQPRQYDAPEMMQQPVQPNGPVGSYAQGGIADAGRYLRGKTDGMADEIETSIDEEQPALLSHGEFVIPADVVSHLGNGNSEAGAEKLYEMMDRIRVARTGTKEQGKEIDPDKFIAAAGGLAAAYKSGGEVQRFNNGGTPNTPTPTTTGAGGIPQDVSRTSTLSPWVGDYVTDALGKGAALANAPYQAYQGPLTAGASNLQNQAFAGASEMAMAGYTPGQFTGGFNAQTAQQYMNPYLQASLDPQLRELQRRADIQRVADAGRLTQAGAYGGSRQAIMESEGRRNLLDKQQDVLGQGYKTAYDLGLGQFNKEREADEASRQFGANFGLKSVSQLADLGAVERGITSEGIAADKAQFEEQRDFAYGMPKYQLGLLSGLPIGSNTTAVDQDALSKLYSQISGVGSTYKLLDKTLKELGQIPSTPAAPAAPKP